MSYAEALLSLTMQPITLLYKPSQPISIAQPSSSNQRQRRHSVAVGFASSPDSKPNSLRVRKTSHPAKIPLDSPLLENQKGGKVSSLTKLNANRKTSLDVDVDDYDVGEDRLEFVKKALSDEHDPFTTKR